MSTTSTAPASVAAHISAHLFGVFTLERDGQLIPMRGDDKSTGLLAYLLLHRQTARPRAQLAGLFWPDCPEEKARRALSAALWRLQRKLELNVFQTEGDQIGLAPAVTVWLDVEAFATLAASPALADLRQAVALYRGPLLEGLYADWITPLYDRLQDRYLQSLEFLSRAEKSAGQYEAALATSLQLFRAAPQREDALREAMRLCVVLERPAAALQHFEAGRHRLQTEFELAPQSETLELARAMAEIARRAEAADRAQPAPPALPQAFNVERLSHLPLVGREAERAQLVAWFMAVQRQQRRNLIVLLEGEAGVGKTRLLQAFAQDARWRGAQVLWGRAHEELGAAYGPLVEAMQTGLTALRLQQLAQDLQPIWLQVLACFIPALRTWLPELTAPPALEPAEERDRLVEAFAQVLSAWVQITPLVVVLDDMHWADDDTLALGVALTKRLRELPLLILCAYREMEARAQPEVWESLQTLQATSACERLALQRLTAEQTAELIRQGLELARAAPALEHRLHQETQGNPLFVVQTLRALWVRGVLYRDAHDGWSTPFDETTEDYAELFLPRAMEATIAQRLRYLSPGARQTLQALAVLGEEGDYAALQAVSTLDLAPLAAALQELTLGGLLEETADHYRFEHDKVRAMVYQQLAAEERRVWHQRLVTWLEKKHPEQPARLALHCERGELWDKAAAYYFQSGQLNYRAYAHQTALAHCTRALQILEEKARGAPLPQPALRLQFEILLLRRQLYWAVGGADQQAADLAALQAVAGQRADPVCQTQALLQYADFLVEVRDDCAQAQQVAAQAQTMAQAQGLTELEAQAWEIIGLTCRERGQNLEAEAALAQALTLWRQIEQAAPQQAFAAIGSLRALLVDTYRCLGRLDEAEAQGQALLAHVETIPTEVEAQGAAHSALALLAQARGDYAACLQHNQTGLACMQASGLRSREAALWLNLGHAYWEVGDYGSAYKKFSQALLIYRQLDKQRGVLMALSDLGGLYVDTGYWPEAQRVLEETLHLAERLEAPEWKALTLCSLAACDLGQNRLEAAEAHWRQAQALAQTLTAVEVLADTGLVQGQLCWQRGQHAAAARCFEQTYALAQKGGQWDCAALASSYLALGWAQEGRLVEAQQRSAQTLHELKAERHLVYLHHWQILRAAGETAAAQATLEEAYRLVQNLKDSLPDPQWQKAFLENVPASREILAAHAQRQSEIRAGQTSVTLPRLEAHRRGPLAAAQKITVIWTPHLPEDEGLPDKKARTRRRLQRLLQEAEAQGAAPTVSDLAAALDVSVRTINFYLSELRQASPVPRTRGSSKPKI